MQTSINTYSATLLLPKDTYFTATYISQSTPVSPIYTQSAINETLMEMADTVLRS